MNHLGHMSQFERVIMAGSEWNWTADHWVALKLCSGFAYLLEKGRINEIPRNSVLLSPPHTVISILASKVGPATLCGVVIRVDALSGCLTLMERQYLERPSAQQLPPSLLVAESHPLAVRLAEIEKHGKTASLPNRFAFLLAFAELLFPRASGWDLPEPPNEDAKARLRQFMTEMPDSELANFNLGELARHLHCCERHASRLFREVWGHSFRSYILKLRLEKACQLLLQGNPKIIDVALESGHGSLSVFNYLFKKRFKMTPTEWRSRNLQRGRRSTKNRMPQVLPAVLLACLGALGVHRTGALEPVSSDPGRSARTNAPPQPATNSATTVHLEVRRYEISGNTLLTESRINDVLAPYTGPAVDFETVRRAKAALQSEYVERGYLTVAVSVPAQQVTNGIIQFDVVEGRLAEVNVVKNRYFSSNNVMRALPGLHTNRVLNGKLFQAELDRANKNPDRQIYPEVRAGPEPGTSALTLEVKDRLPLHARVELNNYNTPGTPELRVNSNIAYNNLWQLEHALGLQYGFSPELMKEGSIPGIPLSPFDSPVVSYYSAFYRAPLGPPASVESSVEKDPTHFGFNEVTRQFVAPPSFGRPELNVYGTRSTSDTVSEGERTKVVDTALMLIENQKTTRSASDDYTAGLRTEVPLPMLYRLQSSFSVGLDYKNHYALSLPTNWFYVTTIITNELGRPVVKQDTTGIPGDESQQSLDYIPFFLGWNGSLSDPLGQTRGGLSGVFCPGGPFSDPDSFRKNISPHANGQFLVGRLRLSRSQPLFKEWTLVCTAEGQLANQPLVSLEQFGIGGVGSVRGYNEGELYGDNGWSTQIELQSPTVWANINLGSRSANVGLGASIFTDYGHIYLIDPQGRPPDSALWGTGIGGNLLVGSHMEIRASIGWPLLDSVLHSVGQARATFAVSAQF
jgi:hemolysin activation/secretion protein/AraC-like DNA-binding protein